MSEQVSGTTRPKARSVPKPARTLAAAWILFSLLGALWAVATPIAASPDEPAHLVKAASVVRGEWVGTHTPRGHVVEVPQYIAFSHGQTCYAFRQSTPADCIPPTPGDPARTVTASTTAGLYNPLYYLIVGWPSLLFGDVTGIFAMRIVSAVVCAGLIATAFVLVRRLPSPNLMTVAFGTAATPMLFFLSGSVNPNGFEAAAVLCFFAGMLALVLSPARKRVGWVAAAIGISFAFAANARGLSLVWLAVAGVVPLLLLGWRSLLSLLRRPPVLVLLCTMVASAAASIVWLLTSNSLGTSTINAEPGFEHPGTGRSFVYGFLRVLEGSFEYGEGIVGIFGWLDTPSPSAVYFLWATLAGSLVLVAFAVARRRRLLFLAALVVAFLFVPALIQGIYITDGGLIWQGRYNIPLYVCLILGAAVVASTGFARFPPELRARLFLLAACAACAAHVYAFAAALRRYAVGVDGSWLTTFGGPSWQAPGGNITLCLLLAAVLATAVLLYRRELRRDGAVPASDADGSPSPLAGSTSRPL